MKKRIGISILLLCITAMLTACADSTDNTENNKRDSQETEDGFVEQPLDLANYSLDYELKTDDQPFFIWSQAAKSEYGYYYFKSSNLVFFDKNAKAEVPVCNKADCTHDGSGCNAYFGGWEYNFSTFSLQYYDGFVYIVGYDNTGYTSLISIAADGSSREEYMKLYKADLTSTEGDGQSHWRAPEFCIHRDYVYFIDNKESVPKIRRMKLGSTETEIVFETSGARPFVYRMLGYGDYIFFQTGNYTDETYLESKGGIYAYNIHTGEIQLVKKDAISTYIIVNDTIYYNSNGNTEFRSFDLVTHEDVLFLDNIIYQDDLSADEHYVYKFSDAGMLSVYDHEGNPVCTVNQSVEDCYFGDGTYIIGRDYDFDIDKHLSCIIDVSDFADGKAEWIYLE